MQIIEKRIIAAGSSFFDAILSTLGYSTPADPTDAVDLIIMIVAVFKSSQIHRISVQDMLEALLKDYKTTIKEADDRKSSQQAIFTIICWFTALVKPAMDNSANNTHTSIIAGQSAAKPTQGTINPNRPIGGLIRSLGSSPPYPEAKALISHEQSGLMYVASLNAYSLKKTGRVSIQWVDVLSDHEDFQPSTRTLMLFWFPTFCALNCLGEQNEHLFDR